MTIMNSNMQRKITQMNLYSAVLKTKFNIYFLWFLQITN